jgi:hypothetical protein
MPLIETAEQLATAILKRPRHVAECLQRLHRFGGQFAGCNVLIHSLEVAWLCRHESPHVQAWALLHDCHEIITGEIVRPAKTASVERLQDEIDWHIQQALGLKITAAEKLIVSRHDIDTGAAEYGHGEHMQYRYAQYGPNDRVCLFEDGIRGAAAGGYRERL